MNNDVRELIDRIPAAIKATEYKYFGDYEMSDGQRDAVEVLVQAALALTAALEREEALREALRTAQDHVCMAYCHFDDETREASTHQPVCDKLRTALENTNGN